jgi:antitoxin HicB
MIEVMALHMTEYSYTVLFEPAEEGGFVVTCPALPGLVTEGDTIEEARQMARDAIQGYLESLHKDHQPIPPDRVPLREEVSVLLPEPA